MSLELAHERACIPSSFPFLMRSHTNRIASSCLVTHEDHHLFAGLSALEKDSGLSSLDSHATKIHAISDIQPVEIEICLAGVVGGLEPASFAASLGAV